MEKRQISLRSIRLEDAAPMLDILTSEIVGQTYMLPIFTYREEALPIFYKLADLSTDETHYVRGIYLNETLIGFMNDVEIKNGMIELGYVIHPDYHGRGYMTEALKSAIEELIGRRYREIVTGAFEHNIASIRVMEKAGMIRMQKVDGIEYRGNRYKCIYYHTTTI